MTGNLFTPHEIFAHKKNNLCFHANSDTEKSRGGFIFPGRRATSAGGKAELH